MCVGNSSGSHFDPYTHRSQRPSCRHEASEAAHTQGRALLRTCSSLIQKPWEPHINHVLMNTALISQAVTCCQPVLLTPLFRAVMRSREEPVWKWAKWAAQCHMYLFGSMAWVVFLFFFLLNLEWALYNTTTHNPMYLWALCFYNNCSISCSNRHFDHILIIHFILHMH